MPVRSAGRRCRLTSSSGASSIRSPTRLCRQRLDDERLTAYIGFDPTADSLHVGHLLQVLQPAAAAARRAPAHRPGRRGNGDDRRPRRQERGAGPPVGDEELAANLAGIRAQLERFLDFSDGAGGVTGPAARQRRLARRSIGL